MLRIAHPPACALGVDPPTPKHIGPTAALCPVASHLMRTGFRSHTRVLGNLKPTCFLGGRAKIAVSLARLARRDGSKKNANPYTNNVLRSDYASGHIRPASLYIFLAATRIPRIPGAMSPPLLVLLGWCALSLGLCLTLLRWARGRLGGKYDDDDVDRVPGPLMRSSTESASFASWIWGHELLVFAHSAVQMYAIWAREFGGLYKIRAALFHRDILIVTDHAAVQHIFAHSARYVKSPAFRPPIRNVIGEGLVWAEGDDWHQQRRVLGPAFSADSVREMTAAIHGCAERLESRLVNLVLGEASTTVNILHYISDCTLDIIGTVALSYAFDSQTLDESASASSDAEQIRSSWVNHVDTGITFPAFVAQTVLRALPAVTSLPLPLMQTQGVIKTIVREIGQQILDRESSYSLDEMPKERPKDILTILLRERKKLGNRLSDEQILDNVRTGSSDSRSRTPAELLSSRSRLSCESNSRADARGTFPADQRVSSMVGHETTAGTLSFILLELARQPLVQERLRAEIASHERDLPYEDIQKLEYLDAVVKEGLRLHPASPQTERVARDDDFIPLSTPLPHIGAGLRVKKGQILRIPFLAMHTNPRIWGPTADLFDPSRWLAPPRDPAFNRPHGWNGLLSFCDGPRNCVGWRLAVLELKIILLTLVRSIVFVDTGVHVDRKISPTLQPVVNGKGSVLPLHLKLV
ncbi:unnamed protein product [Mycena citricolor]|uniref:Cytochrome P450 n=1 Tax=Mycena citricolor TaxID=2018698 RepID=A0AAD2HEU7_9AGAR|nr:unnamed protein product [Mycena citricolor]